MDIIIIIWNIIWKDKVSQAVTHKWDMNALFYGATIILKLRAHALLIFESAVTTKFYMLQTNLHNTGGKCINKYVIDSIELSKYISYFVTMNI